MHGGFHHANSRMNHRLEATTRHFLKWFPLSKCWVTLWCACITLMPVVLLDSNSDTVSSLNFRQTLPPLECFIYFTAKLFSSSDSHACEVELLMAFVWCVSLSEFECLRLITLITSMSAPKCRFFLYLVFHQYHCLIDYSQDDY